MKRAVDRAALLFAVKPRWSTMLLDGSKTVEFRRRGPDPRTAIGKPFLLYASAPVCTLVGYGRILDCIRESPLQLWNRCAKHGGVKETEFDTYFRGTTIGDALIVECAPLARSLTLDLLQQAYNWRPPMSWSWLAAESPLVRLIPTRQT
jgi:predicted transcriptional regulator